MGALAKVGRFVLSPPQGDLRPCLYGFATIYTKMRSIEIINLAEKTESTVTCKLVLLTF